MQSENSQFLNPDHILQQISIKAGAFVGDLGCGTGYMSFAASKSIGSKGKVYAVDVQKDVLSQVKKEAQVENIQNIETVWADLEITNATNIAQNSLDVVFLVNVLFQVSDKTAVFAESKRLLKPNSILLVVEWRVGEMAIGPNADKRVPADSIAQLATSANFSKVQNIDAGKYHYGLLFRN
jgi:ubiquinone/menaquinone biosynthesis C-methylase UbiE